MRLRCLIASLVATAALLGTLLAGSAWGQAPSNDTFANATVIPSLPFTDTVDTTQATTDSDDVEALASCGGAAGITATVWYAYTAPRNELVTVDTFNSTYPAGAAVVQGAPGSFSLVSCGPNSVSFSATAGQTYYIDVGDGSGGNGGTLRISVTSISSAPPEVHLSIDRFGSFDPRTGVATVTGTATCTDGASGNLDVSLTQQLAFATISGNGFTNLLCDGTVQPWSVSVQPFNGKFKGGHAEAFATAFVGTPLGFAFDNVERTIQLRGAR